MKRRWPFAVAALLLVASMAVLLRSRNDPARAADHRAPTQAAAREALREARAGAKPAGTREAASAPALEVMVVDRDGKPVADALVELFAPGEGDEDGWRSIARLHTSAAGRASRETASGRFLVFASKSGVGAASKVFVKPLFERVSTVSLILGPAGSLRGRLLTRAHEAVPLGRVTMTKVAAGSNEAAFAGGAIHELRSDASGNFFFDELEAGAYRLSASADGFATASKSVSVPARDIVELVLEQAGFLQGRVEDEAGRPASGVEVIAAGATSSARATTGGEGSYSLELSAGAYSLAATASDGRAARSAGPVVVQAGQTLTAPVLRLAAGASIAGAISSRGGKVISGARVSLAPAEADATSGHALLATALSGADGAYELRGIPAGAFLLQAAAPGFRPRAQVVSVLPGQRARIDVALFEDGAVVGFVRDARGAAIPGAQVRGGSRATGVQGAAIEGETLTDRDGRYLLEGLSPGKARLIATRPGSPAGPTAQVDVPEEGLAEADFVIGDPGNFAGHVSLANGRPLEGPAVINVRLHAVSNDYRALVSFAVDASGDFSATLPEGDYRVTASLIGQRVASAEATVHIEANATARQDFVIADDPGGAPIRITVQDLGGAPAAGALGIMEAQLGQQRIATTMVADSAGMLSLGTWGNMPVDSMQITAVLQGRSGTLALHRPTTDAQIALTPAAAIRGTVRGLGAGSATVAVLPGDGGHLPCDVPEQRFSGESFEIDALPPAVTLVRVTTSDGRTGEQTVALRSGEVGEVQIDLSPAASVSGRVVDRENKPLPAFVSLEHDETCTTGADGIFRFDQLAAGEHKLSIVVSAQVPAVTRAFHLAAGEALHLGDLAAAGAKRRPPRTTGELIVRK